MGIEFHSLGFPELRWHYLSGISVLKCPVVEVLEMFGIPTHFTGFLSCQYVPHTWLSSLYCEIVET